MARCRITVLVELVAAWALVHWPASPGAAQTDCQVWAYYMGFWTSPGAWEHQAGILSDRPSRGHYSTGDPGTMAAQIDEAKSAGIDAFIVDWWGPGDSGTTDALNNALGLERDSALRMGLVTVTLTHIAFNTAFVAVVVRTSLKDFSGSLEEAAQDLGANEITTFRRITLPLIMPGIVAGALLAFTLSLDNFVITFFVTGPGGTTLPIEVFGRIRRSISPEINAISTIMLVVSIVLIVVSQLMQRRR